MCVHVLGLLTKPHLAFPTSEGTPPAAQSLPPAHLPDLESQGYLQGEVETPLSTA